MRRGRLKWHSFCHAALLSGCPLLARSGHHTRRAQCPLWGAERTLRRHALLFLSQSVCGGSPSSLSLAVSIAMRMSASVRVRFGLNASSSYASCASLFSVAACAAVISPSAVVACGLRRDFRLCGIHRAFSRSCCQYKRAVGA